MHECWKEPLHDDAAGEIVGAGDRYEPHEDGIVVPDRAVRLCAVLLRVALLCVALFWVVLFGVAMIGVVPIGGAVGRRDDGVEIGRMVGERLIEHSIQRVLTGR